MGEAGTMFTKITSKKANSWLLFVGVVMLSLAGVMIKLANASVYGVAFYRLIIAAAIFAVVANKDIRSGFGKVTMRTLLWMVLGGIIFSLHLILWIYSLKTVSVFIAMVIMASNPVYATIGAYIIFKEKPRDNFILAFIIAFVGTVLIFWEGIFDLGSDYKGMIAVFISTLLFAAYILTGKKVRTSASSGFYIFVLYSSAATVCFIGMLLSSSPIVSYSTNSYLYFILLAIFPTVIGHGALNHCVVHFKASTVTMITLLEPVIGSFVAYFVLGEAISSLAALGFSLIILGVGSLFKSEFYNFAKGRLWS